MGEFGIYLKTLRKRAGLSQQALAIQIGADDSYLSRIERGIYPPPSRDKVLAILDALAVTDEKERVYLLLAADRASLEDMPRTEQKGKERYEQETEMNEELRAVYDSPLSIPRLRIMVGLLETVENNLQGAIEGLSKIRGLVVEILDEEE